MVDAPLASIVRDAVAERDAFRRRQILRARIGADVVVDVEGERALAAAIDDADVHCREAALDVCFALGLAALPLLRRLVAHHSARTRRLVVDALARLGDDGATVLVGVFCDPLLAVRAAAVDAFARAAGRAGVPTLLDVLGAPDTSPTVALSALLGVESAEATCPRALLARWLADPLTSTAALRLAGRAGDVEVLLPALDGASPLQRRAAIVGLADALGGGARVVDLGAAHATLMAAVVDADVTVAGAAVVVLAHAGDLEGLVSVIEGGDGARLLPALHRAVTTLGRQQQGVLLERLQRTGAVGDVAREMVEALQRLRAGASSTRGETAFDAVAAWFEETLGLALDRATHARLRARLAVRMDALRIGSPEAYLHRLQNDATEAAAAFDVVTIHETYFFREEPQLAAFRDEVVPTLAAAGRRRLCVWSAGCSTGEEAWTLAALLDDARNAGVIDDYEVIATDVSARAVAHAVEATYAARSFRSAVDERRRALFEWSGEGQRATVRPIARLRERVRFAALNLLDDVTAAVPRCDVVLCRNVLIYLTDAARTRVLGAIHERLRPSGALLLGHSESLLHADTAFTPWPVGRALLWRRGSE